MKEVPDFFVGFGCGVGFFAIASIMLSSSPMQIQKKMQKEAISHGAAYYEVDTNGVVNFKWNK